MATSQTENQPFEQAVRRFVEGLSQDDREVFRARNAEDIIAEVERLNSEHAEQSSIRKQLERFAAIVGPMREFFDAIGTVTKSLPVTNLGGIVWGALLFVVQVAAAYCLHFSCCSSCALIS